MEVNGTKRDRGKATKMEARVKVALKILPFGSANYEITGSDYAAEAEKVSMPRYAEPATTDIENIEIRYEEGATFSIPKTTAGA
jgi:hypothetical protein